MATAHTGLLETIALVIGVAAAAVAPGSQVVAQQGPPPGVGETLRIPGLPGVQMPPGAHIYGQGQPGDRDLGGMLGEHQNGRRRAQPGIDYPSALGPRGFGSPYGRPNVDAKRKAPPPKVLTPAERAAQIRKALAPKPTLAFVRRHTLDDLFGKLATAKDEDEAKGLASVIVGIWMRSGSDTANLMMQRALVSLEKKQYPVALDLLDHLIELKPDWAEAWNKRASVRFFTGDYNGAMADVEHVLKLEPNHFGALDGMASILQHTGFEKRALEVYRRSLAIYPHQVEIQKVVDKLTLEVEGQGI